MVRQVAKSYLPTPIIWWKKRKRELLLRLVIFRLVPPPLRPGVEGLYLVRGVWFPSCLPLNEIGRI
jgi:hypothetical protein